MAQPLKKYRCGGITGALWENQANVNGKDVTMLKVSVERRYKDKNGTWQSSNSFGRNEIPLVIHLLNKAYSDIIDEQQNGDSIEEIQIE